MLKLNLSKEWLKAAANAEEGHDVECGVRNADGVPPVLAELLTMIEDLEKEKAAMSKHDLLADKFKEPKSGVGCCWFDPCRCSS